MKKQICFLTMAILLVTSFYSCKKSESDPEPTPVTVSPIKSMGVVYGTDVERYDITYDANKRIAQILDYWNAALDKTITYDWTVAGKLTISSAKASSTVYDINSSYMVTKEDWGNGEYAKYEYDANGYLIKIIEHWGDADHLKMLAEVSNGNVIKHTTYDDDGVTAKKIKVFTFTNGDNVNEIQQTNMVDNNTKPLGNLFGKSSKKLVDFLEYWDPREDPIVKKKTTITYEFDTQNRPTKITRSGIDWQEIYTYSY